jgi:hypothetical protein
LLTKSSSNKSLPKTELLETPLNHFKLKKLLASHYNIKTVQFVDNSEVDRHYVFSDKMLANEIFIEYYTIDTLESDENEEIEDDTDGPEYGSQLSVVMKHSNRYYQFLMFHDTFEIGFPVMLLQTIVFLVKLIEEAEPNQLIEYLTEISSDPLIPHDIADRAFRDVANKMLKLKIKTIHNLIQEDKADLN